jgi:hypothetical protein
MSGFDIILALTSFLLGYLLRTFIGFRNTYSAASILVDKTSKQLLKLIGHTVYRIAFVDFIYQKAIEESSDKEYAKICKNELDQGFEDWKTETINVFMENYPEEFEWQLEVNDWNSAMRALTELYKERRQ